jgi:hypothetical protein
MANLLVADVDSRNCVPGSYATKHLRMPRAALVIFVIVLYFTAGTTPSDRRQLMLKITEEEPLEGLVEEYCKAVKQRNASESGTWQNTTAARINYLKMRIPMLLRSVDNYIWVATQFSKVHTTNTTPYAPFLQIAVQQFETKKQLQQLLRLVPKSNPMRKTLHERGIELMVTRDDLLKYVKNHLLA